jgi:3'-phosphoadenosine 5'-phosphosulfate sulfotransferase (PAPS reductase)/FAD synthetase
MATYLSFGGGVNSTALLLLLKDQGIEFEAVYADHGTDWPETREYVEMLNHEVYPITVLETRRNGLDLFDYYHSHQMVPQRVARACTVEYKLLPLANYMATPCTVYIGIDAGESHRVQRLIEGQREGEEKLFPLVDEGIDRKACIEIIKAHGLPVPMKSGCYICPFQRMSQWRELYRLHPELYCKAQRLEDTCNARMKAEGRQPFYLADKPLATACATGQTDMFDESRAERPCLCEM